MFSATLEFVNFYCLLCWLWNGVFTPVCCTSKMQVNSFFPYCNLYPFDGVVPIPTPFPCCWIQLCSHSTCYVVGCVIGPRCCWISPPAMFCTGFDFQRGQIWKIICNALIILDSSVYDSSLLLKSDMSGLKAQILAGYCKTMTQRKPISGLHPVKITYTENERGDRCSCKVSVKHLSSSLFTFFADMWNTYQQKSK